MSVVIPAPFTPSAQQLEHWKDDCHKILDSDSFRVAVILNNDSSTLLCICFDETPHPGVEQEMTLFANARSQQQQSETMNLGVWECAMMKCKDGWLFQAALPQGLSLHLLARPQVTVGSLWSQMGWLLSQLQESLQPTTLD